MNKSLNKKTRIVCTIGPVTESVEQLEKLLKLGMNVVRLNMSHGDHEEHRNKIINARKASLNTGIPVAILMDLAGPKIRLGEFENGQNIVKNNGDTWILTMQDVLGNSEKVSVNYKELAREVKPGSIIMLDDGKKKLEVVKVEGDDIHCVFVVGGELKPRRGVNVPNGRLSIKAFTDKDKKDLQFGLDENVDVIALSFVRYPNDIDDVKGFMAERNILKPVIAKIETQEAIDDIDEILARADGLMVARGDLAIEVPTPKVPLYQKMLISKANSLGKPVITATQMLESMINSPVPTRAEVSDIANAIYDGTDAIMLSEETTLGKFPLEAVNYMSEISLENENNVADVLSGTFDNYEVVDTVTESVVRAAEIHNAKAVIVFTESGSSAKLISRFKPTANIIALTPKQTTVHELLLTRGVTTSLIEEVKSFDEMFNLTNKHAKLNGVESGDTVIISGGMPFGQAGSTNFMIIHEVK